MLETIYTEQYIKMGGENWAGVIKIPHANLVESECEVPTMDKGSTGSVGK